MTSAQPDWSPWTATPSQKWDWRLAQHLYRRAGFGATREQIQRSVAQGCQATLDELFSQQGCSEFDEQMKPMERVLTASQEPMQLASWWLLRMVQTPCQLLEKATLFWHGHFATGADKVQNSRAMLAQNRLIRTHALGRFRPLVHGISRDVAMLVYLDSTDNRKTRPNENYARELMELFCLGPGNYTEKDIKQIARCFTGWAVRHGEFRFNSYQHDGGTKRFLGRSGKFSGEDAVNIVLDQSAAPYFIAKKLVRCFVVDDVDMDNEFCDPIADHLRRSDFDIAQAIRLIVGSRYFYSDDVIGHKVRSPVEMSVGLLRYLEASFNMTTLAQRLRLLGHLPLFPPNVKGWEGGRRWINASTYFGRANLVREIVSSGNSAFRGGELAAIVDRKHRRDPEIWVDQLIGDLLAVPLPDESRQQLIELAGNRRQNFQRQITDVISAIGAMPEFHLG